LTALGKAVSEKLLAKSLELALQPEVRSQDAVALICSVATNKFGRELAWQFVQKYWEKLYDKYQGPFLLSDLIKETVSHFSTEEKAQEVEFFFKTKKYCWV